MDITTVRSYRFALDRADLQLAPGEEVLAGGTWLMSEPQPETTGFVDLSRLGWEDVEVTAEGLSISATCTIAALVAWAAEAPSQWPACAVIPDAANALLASFKIWNTATVGGNICRSFAAAAMVSLAVGLDGELEIWRPDGSAFRVAVAAFVTGNGSNILARGEIVRRVLLPAHALRGTAVLRKIALAEHGRSGAVVTGRLDEDGRAVFTVTAATLTPQVLRFPALPDRAELAEALAATGGYYTDPLGSADWRRGVSAVLAQRIRGDLSRIGGEENR